MNGEVCCILGVCCPAGSDEQVNALATAMATHSGTGMADDWPGATALAHARWILQHFELAPAGSLASFKDAIATTARKHP